MGGVADAVSNVVSDPVGSVSDFVSGTVDSATSNPVGAILTGGILPISQGFDKATGGVFTDIARDITGQEDLEAANRKRELAAQLANRRAAVARQQQIRRLTNQLALQESFRTAVQSAQGIAGSSIGQAAGAAALTQGASQLQFATTDAALQTGIQNLGVSAAESAQAAANKQAILQSAVGGVSTAIQSFGAFA